MEPGLRIANTIGNISSIALLLSPLPTMLRFKWKKSAGVMCYTWTVLGNANNIRPNTLTWPINLIAVLIYFIYIYLFLIYSSKDWRYNILVVMICSFLGLTQLILMGLPFVSGDVEATWFCFIFNITLYASPLTVVLNVYKMKSAGFLPFWVGLAGFVNACVWTVYTLMLPSVVVSLLVVHVFGALSGFQLYLHAVFGHPVDSISEPFKKVFRYIFPSKKKSSDLSRLQISGMI